MWILAYMKGMCRLFHCRKYRRSSRVARAVVLEGARRQQLRHIFLTDVHAFGGFHKCYIIYNAIDIMMYDIYFFYKVISAWCTVYTVQCTVPIQANQSPCTSKTTFWHICVIIKIHRHKLTCTDAHTTEHCNKWNF